jgi:hypothetical protein
MRAEQGEDRDLANRLGTRALTDPARKVEIRGGTALRPCIQGHSALVLCPDKCRAREDNALDGRRPSLDFPRLRRRWSKDLE